MLHLVKIQRTVGMKIHQLYEKREPVISLEVFPPKKESGLHTLQTMLEQVKTIQPAYISVTYGAGGTSVSNQTLTIAQMLKETQEIEPLHHLTCVGKSKAELRTILAEIKAAGIENLLVLRGDLPETDQTCVSDFPLAKDLIAFAKQEGDFSIAAACYPEGHIEQASDQENFDHLKAKQDAGADFFISQLFFHNDSFYRMVEGARNAGVTVPIAAGIMPIMSRTQVEKMIFMCGASLPSKLIKLIHRYEHQPEALRQAALEYALEQCEDLIAHGVDGIHLYSMNRPVVAKTVLQRLGGPACN